MEPEAPMGAVAAILLLGLAVYAFFALTMLLYG
jgi:hypothetical protein